MNSAARCVVLVLGLGPVGPGGLAAQERRDTIPVEPIVVTATRLPVPLGAVTAAVTVITGAELRSQGIAYVLDALRVVPGVAVVQGGSFGGLTSLFLRGGESDYVRVLVDGVTLNRPGGAVDLGHLTTDNVERIEIVRGPASVLYGSDAVAGVVQVFTRAGSGAPRFGATVRAGTYGTTAADVEFSGGTDVAGYSFSVSRFDTDGAYAYNNHYRNTTAAGLVSIVPDGRTEARLSLRYQDHRFHFPTDGAGQLVDRNQFTLEEGTTLGLEVGRFLTPRLEARVLLASHLSDGGFDDQRDDAGDTLGLYAYRSLENVRRQSADVRANLSLPPGTVLTAGVAVEQARERSVSEYRSSFGDGHDAFDASRGNRAYYLQGVARARRGFSVQAGARLEDNERFGTFVTYRAGAAYRLRTRTRVRAGIGAAFKEPTFFENYATGFVRGNPRLDPEQSRSLDAGVEQTLAGGRLALSVTYFDQRFRDLIQYIAAPADSTGPNYVNVGAAKASGLELEARFAAMPGLSADLRYTYLAAAVTESGPGGSDAGFSVGERLLRRPTHSASLGAGYRLGSRGALHASVLYVGDRDDLDFGDFPATRRRLPSHARVDVAGELRLRRGGAHAPDLTALVRVENVFDAAYQEVLGFPARGRTVLAGARLALGQ